MSVIDLISRIVGANNSLSDCADLPFHHGRTLSGHLSWENTEGSDGHFSTRRPEISETVDLPDLHRVWLLYYTHLTRHTSHLLSLVLLLFVCFQSRLVRKTLVLSREWWPCSSRLKYVPKSLAFPSTPFLDRFPLPTISMEETVRTLPGSSTSTVRFLQNTALTTEIRKLSVSY